MMTMELIGIATVAGVSGLAGILATLWVVRRWGAGARAEKAVEHRVVTQTIAERVRSVGKLVGLEVFAKEIATATSGWGWLPPILLSQAKLAMIFHFEKQYVVDLSRVGPQDVEELSPGRFRLTLPPIEGSLRLADLRPYDIQGMKVLGLVDLMSMTAERQSEMMKRAQQEASALFSTSDERYLLEARAAVERHVQALVGLFGVEVLVAWRDRARVTTPEPVRIEAGPGMTLGRAATGSPVPALAP
jgi:hypothetical protein